MSPLSNDEILQLSFQQLRSECKKANLSATGNTQALRKRLQDCVADDDKANQGVKRKKEAVQIVEGATVTNKRPKKSPADDLICPITLELTWEPVTADDGRVYEKDAIEKHIKTQRENGAVLKSPVTNEPMGERLLPSRQRSLIETLIESGSIKGDLASTWNKKVKEATEMEELQRKANAGDLKAILQLQRNYRSGLNGFKKNKLLAFQWRQKGHDLGCVKSTSLLGDSFFYGVGVPKCERRGVMYLTMGATQGSDFAAFCLGELLVPQDKKEAIRWIRMSLSPYCQLRHMHTTMKERAKAMLEKLLNENDEGTAGTEGPPADV